MCFLHFRILSRIIIGSLYLSIRCCFQNLKGFAINFHFIPVSFSHEAERILKTKQFTEKHPKQCSKICLAYVCVKNMLCFLFTTSVFGFRTKDVFVNLLFSTWQGLTSLSDLRKTAKYLFCWKYLIEIIGKPKTTYIFKISIYINVYE